MCFLYTTKYRQVTRGTGQIGLDKKKKQLFPSLSSCTLFTPTNNTNYRSLRQKRKSIGWIYGHDTLGSALVLARASLGVWVSKTDLLSPLLSLLTSLHGHRYSSGLRLAAVARMPGWRVRMQTITQPHFQYCATTTDT